MSAVSEEFLARWRQETAVLTGGTAHRIQRPVTKVYLRTGRLRRNWEAWTGPDINAYVVGGNNDEPWRATYHATSEWLELPNVMSCDLTGSITDKGSNATIVIENIVLEETSGFSGLYHAIRRGWLSPWRGSETEFTPPAVDAANDWYSFLDQRAQVKVWQGYGDDELVPTFLGFIDDLDLVSRPDQITITARDATAIPADQRFYGWSKIRDFADPLTFADRISAENSSKEGFNPDASSEQTDHEAELVLDGDSGTAWWSDDNLTANNTEWIEIEIPEGKYDRVRLNTKNYPDMLAYIAIYSVDGEINDVPVGSDGWLDYALGDVPGANGGFPYIKTHTTIDGNENIRLPDLFTAGEGSKIRIAFRDLKRKAEDTYRAGVTAFKAVKQPVVTEERTEGWILVDDVSDIVRLILRWCGFKEWYVEDADMRLKDRWVVNRESFLMDMIDSIVDRTGFSFFIADPSTDDESLGYPIFRENRALYDYDADEVVSISEADLLRRVQVRFTDEVLSSNIRVRGRLATKDEGGVVVSRDARRLLGFYRPPWRDDGNTPAGTRTAGIIKRTFLDRFWIKTQEMADYAARLVALFEAIASATALIEVPANPGIELDEHVLLYDQGSGLNTRMWVNARSSSFSAGDEPRWTMSLNGALLDTPYMEALIAEVRTYKELSDG